MAAWCASTVWRTLKKKTKTGRGVGTSGLRRYAEENETAEAAEDRVRPVIRSHP